MLDDITMMWFALRGRRAGMPTRSKLNESDERKLTFAASMAQFEEQYAAAKVVSEATRPLNLYYGLAQVGLAIASAYADEPWKFSSHGLRLSGRTGALADMTVGPSGNGGFQKVATSIGSPGIVGPVTLGALWASVPELAEVGVLPGSRAPVPVPLLAMEAPGTPEANLFVPSDDLTKPSEVFDYLRAIKRDYPGSGDWGLPAGPDAAPFQSPGRTGEKWVVRVSWITAGQKSAEELTTFFDEVAPAYRYRSERYFWSAINGDAAPTPLMTWWLLLYSFSILARYEPQRWTELLDVDNSDTAVLLQYMLTEALCAVPQLVVGALDRRQFLLAKSLVL